MTILEIGGFIILASIMLLPLFLVLAASGPINYGPRMVLSPEDRATLKETGWTDEELDELDRR